MKNKHRIKQGLSLLLAGGIALTNLGAALPAFAEDAAVTPETAQTATLDPEAAVSVDAVEPQAAKPMVMAAAIIRETAFFMSIPP